MSLGCSSWPFRSSLSRWSSRSSSPAAARRSRASGWHLHRGLHRALRRADDRRAAPGRGRRGGRARRRESRSPAPAHAGAGPPPSEPPPAEPPPPAPPPPRVALKAIPQRARRSSSARPGAEAATRSPTRARRARSARTSTRFSRRTTPWSSRSRTEAVACPRSRTRSASSRSRTSPRTSRSRPRASRRTAAVGCTGLERCPSGLRSATGNRVRAERCVAGSNPALSAQRPRKGSRFVDGAEGRSDGYGGWSFSARARAASTSSARCASSTRRPRSRSSSAHLAGGECSYYACIPTKTLLRPTEALAAARHAPGAAEAVTGELDLERVFWWRDQVTDGRDDSWHAGWLEEQRATLVRGEARIARRRTRRGRGARARVRRARHRDRVHACSPADRRDRGRRLLDEPRGGVGG